MLHDPIADLLTRVRNGYMARLDQIIIPCSKVNMWILKIFKKNKYIHEFEEKQLGNNKKEILVTLNKKIEYIPTFKRVSRPGQRVYVKSNDIKKSHNWYGIYVISTPKWLMTWYEARSLKIWGEIICEVF